MLIVTHDTHLSSSAERVINIRDGRLSGERLTEKEFSVISPNGLVQIPKELLAKAGFTTDKVTITARENEIVLKQF